MRSGAGFESIIIRVASVNGRHCLPPWPLTICHNLEASSVRLGPGHGLINVPGKSPVLRPAASTQDSPSMDKLTFRQRQPNQMSQSRMRLSLAAKNEPNRSHCRSRKIAHSPRTFPPIFRPIPLDPDTFCAALRITFTLVSCKLHRTSAAAGSAAQGGCNWGGGGALGSAEGCRNLKLILTLHPLCPATTTPNLHLSKSCFVTFCACAKICIRQLTLQKETHMCPGCQCVCARLIPCTLPNATVLLPPTSPAPRCVCVILCLLFNGKKQWVEWEVG